MDPLETNTIPLYYEKQEYKVRHNQLFYLSEDDVEVYYTTTNDVSNITVWYHPEANVRISLADDIVHFMIIKDIGAMEPIGLANIKHPWFPKFKGIRISNFTQDEYDSYKFDN